MGLFENFAKIYKQDTGRDVDAPIAQGDVSLGPRADFSKLHDILTKEDAPSSPPLPKPQDPAVR